MWVTCYPGKIKNVKQRGIRKINFFGQHLFIASSAGRRNAKLCVSNPPDSRHFLWLREVGSKSGRQRGGDTAIIVNETGAVSLRGNDPVNAIPFAVKAVDAQFVFNEQEDQKGSRDADRQAHGIEQGEGLSTPKSAEEDLEIAVDHNRSYDDFPTKSGSNCKMLAINVMYLDAGVLLFASDTAAARF